MKLYKLTEPDDDSIFMYAFAHDLKELLEETKEVGDYFETSTPNVRELPDDEKVKINYEDIVKIELTAKEWCVIYSDMGVVLACSEF